MLPLELIAELLEYPTKWRDKIEEISEEIKTSNSQYSNIFSNFIEEVKKHKELDFEEIYVSTFDNNDYTTLYITYYITGEEKARPAKRGIYLIFLKSKVKEFLKDNELPDYLPVLLRYLSHYNDEEVKKILHDPLYILMRRLKEKDSIFYPLINLAYKLLYEGGKDG